MLVKSRGLFLEVPLTRSILLARWVAIALASTPLALVTSAAHAQEEACAGPLTHEGWLEKMDAADKALAAFAPEQAASILEGLTKEIPCLDTIARPTYLGRFGRQMATIAFFEQDEITSVRWGMLQRYSAPDLPWPDDVGEDHPMREMLEFADEPLLAGPDDKGILFPKKGAVFMNGALLERPKARAEVPNLIQVADKDGVILAAYWQDGAAFREEVLGEPGAVATLPKWFVPEDGSAVAGRGNLFGSVDGVADAKPEPAPKPSPSLVVEPKNQPDPAPSSDPAPTTGTRSSGPRVPQLIVGGGLGIVSGTLYALGASFRGGLDQAANEDDLVGTRSKVNAMVIGAGAAAAAGVGVGVTAFVDAEGGGLRWTLRL